MKPAIWSFFGLVLILCFTAPARADFRLLRKIPVPEMTCDSGTPIVRAMGSDGTDLCLTRGCYLDQLAAIYRIDPDDGHVVNYDEWDYEIPECPTLTMPISMAFSPYDGRFYVGTECGAVVGLAWMETDSAWAVTTFSFGDSLAVPGGMAPGQYSDLFASDREDTDLVRFEVMGTFTSDEPMYGVGDPVAMAAYDQHLFVLDAANAVIMEMNAEAVNVAVHHVEDWVQGGLDGPFEPEAATFIGEHLYLAGNDDSIHVYEFAEPDTYTEPVPEGDSVEVVVLPDELVITFETVTDSGDVNVEVREADACPPPAGVALFPEYYDIGTDATFEYITEVAILDSVYPAAVDQDLVRVFARRSDTCLVWRDITVAPVEEIPVLKILRRSKSEDDEFSVFALGEDNRTPQEVVEFKFADLRGHIMSAEDSIPGTAYSNLLTMLGAAQDDYYKGQSGPSAEGISGLEGVVRGEPGIPHTYSPGDPGRNVAGRIISRAHTLEFSLMFSESTAYYSGAAVVPENIHIGLRFDWLRMFIEVPAELDAAQVDVNHIYLANSVRAVPESVAVFDYDTDGRPEIRALFPGTQAQLAVAASGCNSLARASCFVGGFELHSVADVDVAQPVVQFAGGGSLVAGTTVKVTWERFDCGGNPVYRLAFSADGGETWDLVAAGIGAREYAWTVPDAETGAGLLRVICTSSDGESLPKFSRVFTVAPAAGIDVERAAGLRMALRPNPSAGAVEIEFISPAGCRGSVTVYSVRGEVVVTLFEGRMAEGMNRLTWNGENMNGKRVAAGTYFVVLRSRTATLTEKVVIQR
jgi:hypothetical protein